ncbi:uncharacterized protein LOC134810630 [Pan troglodytes]|uniref:uncharacterized protein LOC134810630 n=1 Tax=Pan troglodytes TaxID=9598 RepID=UPI003013B5E6
MPHTLLRPEGQPWRQTPTLSPQCQQRPVLTVPGSVRLRPGATCSNVHSKQARASLRRGKDPAGAFTVGVLSTLRPCPGPHSGAATLGNGLPEVLEKEEPGGPPSVHREQQAPDGSPRTPPRAEVQAVSSLARSSGLRHARKQEKENAPRREGAPINGAASEATDDRASPRAPRHLPPLCPALPKPEGRLRFREVRSLPKVAQPEVGTASWGEASHPLRHLPSRSHHPHKFKARFWNPQPSRKGKLSPGGTSESSATCTATPV